LRNSLVSAAQEYAKSNTNETSGSAEDRIDKNLKKLEMFNLPMGWDWPNSDNVVGGNSQLAIPPPRFLPWFLKAIGWIITGLAISLGAPFWFDTLNKIMIVRSTVKPHEKSPEEPPLDEEKKS
jgi:hypothetical protein